MERRALFPLIQRDLQGLLNGYVQAVQLLSHLDRYVVAPAFGARAGALGALALAMERTDAVRSS